MRSVNLLNHKRSLLGIVILTLLLLNFKAVPGNDPAIKVMTFNIRYGTADDGKNSWEYRKDLLLETIKQFSPHILAVQEALDFQLGAIQHAFLQYQMAGVGRDDGKLAGEFSAVFFDTTRFDLIRQKTFWYSETPDKPGSIAWGARFPRICTNAVLKARESGETLSIYNNHWDHESSLSRENSANQLIHTIISQNQANDNIIIMGDFNTDINSDALTKLTKNPNLKLLETFSEVNQHSIKIGTFNKFKGIDTGPKIDYIFCSSRFKIISAHIIKAHENGLYPSDHFPVTAILTL